jgi:hypothetical protein
MSPAAQKRGKIKKITAGYIYYLELLSALD